MVFICGPKRQRMYPIHLECIMMLICNRQLWDVETINTIRNQFKDFVDDANESDANEEDSEDEEEIDVI